MAHIPLQCIQLMAMFNNLQVGHISHLQMYSIGMAIGGLVGMIVHQPIKPEPLQ